MFENTTAVPLFPTLVWLHELAADRYRPMNDRLAKEIDAIITPRPPLLPGGNWQTEQDLHEREGFAELLPYIHQATTGVLEFLEIEYESFDITGCWANVNPEGTPHTAHSHANNYLSGVYYVRTPAENDSISFHDPRPQPGIISPKVRQRNRHNTLLVNVPAKEGRLLLFPSWFEHSVVRNSGKGDRISISFNIMFPAFSERMSRPKWQGISGGTKPAREA